MDYFTLERKMKKRMFGMIFLCLVNSAPALAEGQIPVVIRDFVRNDLQIGSMNLVPEETLELFDKDGKLLEILYFSEKHKPYPNIPETSSIFTGKTYEAIIRDSSPVNSYAYTLKQPVKSSKNR
ncbi:hypothetical protein [Gloeobacter morelensis]|uniref:Uncharacterized protein n=1 Tax=Gloeobacter morelensis MG652769 TaxID=2781736 RepID=A0ABY3PHG0_9CYAN|nr:hypothetical protein [Gloeobacter morelensis]UFP93080.1 hypothetical protein ISF26_14825 [Gloeobacter morelensis MG652769]